MARSLANEEQARSDGKIDRSSVSSFEGEKFMCEDNEK
jgi:hypothetical protein